MEHARPPPELNVEGGPVTRADAWKRWKQQFLLFVKASGVSSESPGVQASLLVNLIGPEGFDVYQTFAFAAESEKDDVNVVLKKFDAYFGAKVNITLLRYKFFTRNQEEGESILAYVTALRLLSNNCNFGNLGDEVVCVDGKTRTRATIIGNAYTPRSYIIENKLGGRFRRNRRHLIKCESSTNAPSASLGSLKPASADADDEFKDACDEVGQAKECKLQPNDSKNKVENSSDPTTREIMTRRRAKLLTENIKQKELE